MRGSNSMQEPAQHNAQRARAHLHRALAQQPLHALCKRLLLVGRAAQVGEELRAVTREKVTE